MSMYILYMFMFPKQQMCYIMWQYNYSSLSSSQFGGNPVSMAIADAVLTVIEEEHLQENAAKVGAFLISKLKALEEKYACVDYVRGQGLFIGLNLVKSKETREPDAKLAKELEKR